MTSTTNTTNKPLRRVGTLTLGVCLIAAGVLFLLARFLPGLPWLVIWQVLPAAGLILLGCEVLYYSARPGACRCDFGSVVLCLLMMGGCFGVSTLCCWPRCWAAAAPSTCEHKKACAASRPGRVCTGFFV
mgnify:FL=1